MTELPRHLSGRKLADRYDRLSAEERFRLALEAGARQDDRERERLVQTAPMKPYRVTDPDYLDRVDASRDMAVAVALDLLPRMAQLRMLQVTQGLVGRALSAGACAAADPDERAAMSEAVTEAVEESLVRVFGQAVELPCAEAAALYGAFNAVCRDELGLEPDVVLRAHLGPEIVVQLSVDELVGAKPDKAKLGAWRELFVKAWRRWTTR